ncbi:MAG: thymidylate synthase [Ignavibacteria bacterium]|nr:thymidylate synthase [Ignavibacteria bacterium]MBT8381913.1 thymidylate synthase [Ignavibacteria bacterium]MBT8390596.1 thymidylate synthase [Ignavibacteria bacterium]NNL22383.1 thymidylate synthase [Ignavibacteriaceae bacterium]
MKQYLDLVKSVIESGVRKQTRTGVDTISYFGAFYKVDLNDGFPLLTTKKMHWNSILREVLWYLSGENHIRNLRKYTKIWDAWADENGNLETAYGYYWRHFPSAEKNSNGEWNVREVDQIKYVIDEIKENPNSRRLVVNAWEPGNATKSKLPPCHYSFVFNVNDGKLNCHLTQRSGDIALGIPFNLAAYSLLTQVIAQQTNLELGQFAHTIVDAHIYVGDKGTEMEKYDHLKGLTEQLKREPLPLPQLKIANKRIGELVFEDFDLINYQHHEKIKFEVAV